MLACRRDTHEFDGNLLVIQKVCTLEDDTERTLADFLPHAVVNTHYVRRGGRHSSGLVIPIGHPSFDHRSGTRARDRILSKQGAVSGSSYKQTNNT